jgi:hypothetical protein
MKHVTLAKKMKQLSINATSHHFVASVLFVASFVIHVECQVVTKCEEEMVGQFSQVDLGNPFLRNT